MVLLDEGATDNAVPRGRRVLCLRGDGDDAGLEAMLAEATLALGWQVETLRPDLSRFREQQSFEADHEAVAKVDALISDCERASGVPAGRILVAGDRDLGRGFSAADIVLDESAVTRAVLSDNAEPFRILRRMFVHARDAIADARPELVLLGGRADCWSFVLRLLATHYGIGVLALRRSRLWGDRCYWTGDPAGLNIAALRGVAEKRAGQAAISARSLERIAHSRPSERAGNAAPRHNNEDLASLRYIYVALQQDPSEAPDSRSPFWANQYYLAELACSILPVGHKLFIQEHPANAGRRPVKFYRDLSRLPNVELLDASKHSLNYIAHAALVITDGSPAGWQALLLGRPVITLAENFYSGTELARRVNDPEQLASIVVDTLKPMQPRDTGGDPRNLGWLLDAEWETTAPVEGDPAEALQLLERAQRQSSKSFVKKDVRAPKPGETTPVAPNNCSSAIGSLQGRRVLALLPLGNKDLGKYLVGLMRAGKQRYGWTVSVLSSTADTRSFMKLAAPNGEIFVQPPLLSEEEWERDPHAENEVNCAIREAEAKVGLPLGRVILAAGHSIGRAYSAPYQYFNRYPMLLRVLRNNREPERIARRVFRFADEMLKRNKPDVLFFFHWGTPLNFLTWLAAQRRGIPCVVLRPSKIRHDHAFITFDRLMWNTRAADLASLKIKAKAPVSEAAKNKIEAFRNQPVMIGYIARKWSNRMNLGFFRWHKQYVRIAMTQVMNRFRGQDRSAVEGLFARLVRYYRTLFLSWYQHKIFSTFEPSALAEMKFVYFPMHKEAEMAQTLQATAWHDQRQTIRALAGALPFGYRLLVREHRMNYGRRRTHAYRELAQLPNVTLIDPFDSQFKYLQNASLVVTENGSSGWESLLMKRPTLLLADRTFYQGSGLGTIVTDPDRLHAAVVDLLSKPTVFDGHAYDHALAAMIDAEFESTFPMRPEGFGAALDAFAHLLAPQRAAAEELHKAAAAS